MRKVKVWGGFGEKKSNNNTQFYFQDRIYDSDGISPALTNYKSDYWIMIREDNKSMDESCKNCAYFTDDGSDGECHIYPHPNHGVSECKDWRIRE